MVMDSVSRIAVDVRTDSWFMDSVNLKFFLFRVIQIDHGKIVEVEF